MEIKITLDLNAPRWVRWSLAYVALPLALLLGVGSFVGAEVPLKVFAPGEKILSSEVNANFKAIAQAIDLNKGSVRIPKVLMHPTKTKGRLAAAINGTEVVGYKGAAALCQQAMASTSAHLCTTHEMILADSFDLIKTQGCGWIAGGVYQRNVVNTSCTETNYDCDGYQNDIGGPPSCTTSASGSSWCFDKNLNGKYGTNSCGNAIPLFCCD